MSFASTGQPGRQAAQRPQNSHDGFRNSQASTRLFCGPYDELDDGRHQSKRRQEQDAKKDAYLAAAGMPMLRVAARQAYDVRELAWEIEGMIGGQQT